MKRPNKLPPPKPANTVVEWRYPKAHRYWDKSGEIIAAVEQEFPGLECQELTADGFRFAGKNDHVAAGFVFWNKCNVAQNSPGKDFAEAADAFWRIVRDGLQPSSVSRLGHRTWLCYETNGTSGAVRWLRESTIWQFSRPDLQVFGEPDPQGVVLRSRLPDAGRKVRVELQPGKFEARRGSERIRLVGLFVDVDIVIEGDDVAEVEVAEFVSWNQDYLETQVYDLFRHKR